MTGNKEVRNICSSGHGGGSTEAQRRPLLASLLINAVRVLTRGRETTAREGGLRTAQTGVALSKRDTALRNGCCRMRNEVRATRLKLLQQENGVSPSDWEKS